MDEWVRPNADLYLIQNDLKVDICCSDPLDVAFYNYSKKYIISASLLADKTIEGKDIRVKDSYFFPIAFLYRHSIELILKAICFKHIDNKEDGVKFLKGTFHNLGELFERVKNFELSIESYDSNAVEWLTNYFESINKSDKESDSYRYPFSISYNGKYSIKPIFNEQTHINLVTFDNKMKVAYELLSSIYSSTPGDCTKYRDFDPIFLEKGGLYYGRCIVGYKYSSCEFYTHTNAYKESVELLYDQIENDEVNAENLFLPMCYLYRNALELSLKETLVEECSYTFQESIRHIHNKKHKVMGLWNLIKKEISEHANVTDDDTIEKDAEVYIRQINDFDGASDKFRYPVNKWLSYHFKKSKYFDVKHVKLFFSEILSYLSGVNHMMYEDNLIKAELELNIDQI